MGAGTKYSDALIKRIKLSIHTFAPARVIRFYENEREADIQPLFMTKNKDGSLDKYDFVERAPVLSMRYKIKNTYPASVDGLIGVHGDVNGKNATITPKSEIEYIPFLKPGDIVFCGFSERALDNLQEVPFDPGHRRIHDIKDAVVLGLWGI